MLAQLLLARGDYMFSATGPKQIELNTIASSFGCLASRVSELHALLALPLAERTRQLDLHAVVNPPTAAAFELRNYSRQSMHWHEDEKSLPAAVQHAVPLDAAGDDVTTFEAPATVTLPPKIPDLVRGVTAAESLVAQFESVIVYQGQAYSPFRFWTVERRGMHEEVRKATSLFGRKCKCYLWLRSVNDKPLAEVDMGARAIETASGAWLKTQDAAVSQNVWEHAVEWYQANKSP